MYTEFVTRDAEKAAYYLTFGLPFDVDIRPTHKAYPEQGPLYIIKRKVTLSKKDRETLKLFHVKV